MASPKHLNSYTNSGDVLVEAYDDNGDMVVGTTYDYTRVLKNHEMTQAEFDAYGMSKDFWKVADIPAHVLDDSIRKGALNDRKYWRGFVNDPANARFVYERNGRKIRL